jgi:hypothetical protein
MLVLHPLRQGPAIELAWDQAVDIPRSSQPLRQAFKGFDTVDSHALGKLHLPLNTFLAL